VPAPAPAPAATHSFGRRGALAAGLLAAAAVSSLAPPPRPAAAEPALLVGPPEAGGRFATIGEAVAAVEPGSTVTVLPGRYEERIILDGKFLTIQAAQVGARREERGGTRRHGRAPRGRVTGPRRAGR
jgi:pectin methylesterase-like acyl-CoA thioesterase